MKKAMFLGLLALLFLSIPHPSQARDPLKGQDYRNMYGYQYGFLESPAPDAVVSGIGFISGWRCGGTNIWVNIVGRHSLPVSLGVSRPDTHRLCNGHDKSGFIMQFNWNKLDAGEHEVVAYDEGKEFARHTFTVGHSGKDFWKGLAFDLEVPDFPREGDTGLFVWNESTQHLELAEVYPREEPPLFEPTDLTPLEFLLERSQWTIRVPGIRAWQHVSHRDADIRFDRIGAAPGGFETVTGHLQGTRLRAGKVKPGLPIPFQIGRARQILPRLPSLYNDTYALVIPLERYTDYPGSSTSGHQQFCYIVVFNLIKRGPNGGLDTPAHFTISKRENGECVPNGREEFMTRLLSTRLVIE